MAGIATEASVSRQLVYGHFADLDSLYVAFVQDRLGRYRDNRPDISPLRPANAAATMFQHLLTIPASDRRVIRLLLADVGIPALDRVRKRFVADELGRWGDVLASTSAAAVVSAATERAPGASRRRRRGRHRRDAGHRHCRSARARRHTGLNRARIVATPRNVEERPRGLPLHEPRRVALTGRHIVMTTF